MSDRRKGALVEGRHVVGAHKNGQQQGLLRLNDIFGSQHVIDVVIANERIFDEKIFDVCFISADVSEDFKLLQSLDVVPSKIGHEGDEGVAVERRVRAS